MGLDSFKTKSSNKYKRYGHHEYNERLENWVDELQERFPIDLNIEFIEVSPQMTKYNAKAYKRDGNTYFIRVSERYTNLYADEAVKLTVLHEMVHVYFYQMDYGDTNHDKYFRWVCGRVMASMTNMSVEDQKWKDCIEPFIEQDNRWD